MYSSNSRLNYGAVSRKLLILYGLTVIVMLIIGYVGYGYPLTHFLTENNKFDDFFNSVALASELPSATESYVLSPGLIFIFRLIEPASSVLVFCIYNLLVLYAIYAALKELNIDFLSKVIIAFSYPVIFAFSRGNAELITFSLVFMSIAYAVKLNYRIAIILLLGAIFIKPTAVIWAVIIPLKEWVVHKRFLLIFTIANLISILMVNPNLYEYIERYLTMLHNYKLAYVYAHGGDLFNNSLWGEFKGVMKYDFFSSPITSISVKHAYKYYSNIQIFFILLNVVILVKSYNRNLINFCYALILFPIFLSPVAADYRLLYFLIPISILISKKDWLVNNLTIFILSILIITPKHFVQYDNYVIGYPPVTLQTYVNPILLLSLFVILLIKCFRRNENDMSVMWFREYLRDL